MHKSVAAALVVLAPVPVLAQSIQCNVPQNLPRPTIVSPTSNEERRLVPIGGYTLALTWVPQRCAQYDGRPNASDALQCDRRHGRFGFTLHGLWPDGVGMQWPQYCRSTSLLPRDVIAKNWCMMPSVQLMQHEWAKHGTCMASQPRDYFDKSRSLYQSIRYPDMQSLAGRRNVTVGMFTQALANANRGLGIREDMIRVRTNRNNTLEEVWLCMDRSMAFTRCPTKQRGAPHNSLLRITSSQTLNRLR